jgi:hypothetical protein
MRTTAASADAAKEAVAKVRREGLRLDVCSAVVVPAGVHEAAPRWRTLHVDWDDGRTQGWWRAEPAWVMTIAAQPASELPRQLQFVDRSYVPGA